MHTDYTKLPVCNSEHIADGGPRGPIEADLMDVVLGLRAMITNHLPESKPACPKTATETLPRSSREDALQQEVDRYRNRGGRYARWAEQLAEAEMGWFDSYSLARKVEGHSEDTFLQVDEELDGDTGWQQQLAAAELLEWLELEAGLTDRELMALQCRADGIAQPDKSGETLARARRRAQAALA